MRHTRQRRMGLSVVLPLILGWALAGCGGEQGSAIAARDLSTGEVKTFPSPGDVPPGWETCSDDPCTIPAEVPCDTLGPAVCTLSSACRLKELWCGATVSTGGAGASSNGGASAPSADQCEYVCIPMLPLLCEEVTDQSQCAGRSDCEWAKADCVCSTAGPCTCASSCRPKTDPTCQELGEAECSQRQDCRWGTNTCPACAPQTGGSACTCPASCQPATQVEDCRPDECPATSSTGQSGSQPSGSGYICPGGTSVDGPTGRCVRNAAGQCGWELSHCPPVPQGFCDAAACGAKPEEVPLALCPNSSSWSGLQCVAEAGACAWKVISCPQS